MSLLEDVFLQDEAAEARNLERIIEGEEFDEHVHSDEENSKDGISEAEEEKRRVDPSKPKATRVIKNPRFMLNPARLTGPRGIQVIPEHFKDFKFKGKGHEKEDLDLVLKKLEHWAYRLYPKFKFEDCLKKIETLGKKRPVMVHLHKIRSDQFMSEETVVQKDSSDEENTVPVEDEFDMLLQQQIKIARSTPAPNSTKKILDNSDISGTQAITPKVNEEQRERMLRNRKLAEQRRLARMQQNSLQPDINLENSQSNSKVVNLDTDNIDDIAKADEMEANEPMVIDVDITLANSRNDVLINSGSTRNIVHNLSPDSSDDECATNTAVTADIHVNNEHTININASPLIDLSKSDYVDLDNNEPMVIDVDGIHAKSCNGNVNSNSTNNIVHNLSSDSSDDECVTNTAIIADIHVNNEHTIKVNESSLIDLSKSDYVDLDNEPMVIDVDGIHAKSCNGNVNSNSTNNIVHNLSPDNSDDGFVINSSVMANHNSAAIEEQAVIENTNENVLINISNPDNANILDEENTAFDGNLNINKEMEINEAMVIDADIHNGKNNSDIVHVLSPADVTIVTAINEEMSTHGIENINDSFLNNIDLDNSDNQIEFYAEANTNKYICDKEDNNSNNVSKSDE